MSKGTKKNKFYFSQEVEDAIIRYNKETDDKIKRDIYNKEIKYAFNKLSENMLNTFKFMYITETFKNKKNDVISHLILNIDKYVEGKGKAFSYFSIMAKNYLIIQNDQNYKNLKVDISLDLENDEKDNNKNEIIDPDYYYYSDSKNEEEFIKLLIKFYEKNIPIIFSKKRDIDIANSILLMIQEYKSIENFNKKNIYLLIRELCDYNSIYITKVLNKMKDIYLKLLYHYNTYGDIPSKYTKIM